MQQSNVIFAALVIGFILFITNKGELPTYIQFLRGGGTVTPTGGTSSASPVDTGMSSLGSLGTITSFLGNSNAPDIGNIF